MECDSTPAGCEHDYRRPTILRSDSSRQSAGVMNARVPCVRSSSLLWSQPPAWIARQHSHRDAKQARVPSWC